LQPALVVFDLDGTLIDSAPDMHLAVNRTLARLGCNPLSLPEIRTMVGDGAAALIARALGAPDGAVYSVEARLFAPLIVQLQPGADIAASMPALARALLAARQLDPARSWIGALRAQGAGDPGAAAAAASFAVVAKLAKLDDAPLGADSLAAWGKAGADLPADRSARRGALGFALLAAVGEPVPAAAWLPLLDAFAPVASRVPPAAVELGLEAAASAKRAGETILFADLALGDGTTTELDAAALARIVASLKSAGFEDEARSLALEAALANGV